ncbi:MAG TPA: diacylglycerol kinase family protein [Jiangellaceae bacterium]
MRALVVVNPNATTTSVRTRDVLITALRNDLELEVTETTHRGHAAELAERARDQGMDLVVAVGGDGTVNEVVNGVLAPGSPDPAGRPPVVAIVPGGSTNVLARNLGIPENPVEATGLLLDALRAGRSQPIGLGRVDGRYFTFAAGAGLDADVIHAVEEQRARGRTATVPLYVRTALRRYFAQDDRKAGPIVVEAEDAEPIAELSVVIISNCTPWTYVGARPLRPTPQADFNDGLDVFGLTRLGVPSTLRHVAQMASRRGPRGRHVVTLHDQARLVLTSAIPVPLQVDGDYLGRYERAEFVAVPDAIRIAY